jgi:hypothetical protein
MMVCKLAVYDIQKNVAACFLHVSLHVISLKVTSHVRAKHAHFLTFHLGGSILPTHSFPIISQAIALIPVACTSGILKLSYG